MPQNYRFLTIQRKNTIKVLADAKMPVLSALEDLGEYGITGIRDFYYDTDNMKLLDRLDEYRKRKLTASINNFRLLKEAEKLLHGYDFSPEAFGSLIREHHENLRDGLGISTPAIEKIFEEAYKNGALGGKVNGSGGGGCLFVYAHDENCERILKAVNDIGYNGRIIRQDTGVRMDREEMIP